MAAKEDDGSANDLHFGPITIDVPDDLSDIKRDLKFYQKVGEAYDSRKVGKAASALLSGQKFGRPFRFRTGYGAEPCRFSGNYRAW